MKNYTKEELAAVITEHGKWLRNEGESRADLSGADLSGAVQAWAQVAFMGHGQCGRMLTAVIYAEGQDAVYQCGCFIGSLAALEAYIKAGEEKHRESRTLAMTTATKLLFI